MIKEWADLSRLAAGQNIIIERVRLEESGVHIEGEFVLPALARLSGDDQIFVMAFVGTHGSIKDMERLFGISYPTVKNRLEKLADRLQMVEFEPAASDDTKDNVLSLLEKGEIAADEAIRRIRR